MTKKDKEEIRKIIQEELKAALVRTVMVERGARKQGDPEKVVKEEEWNVLEWFVVYAPLIEGALRGMQGDVSKVANKVDIQGVQIEALGNILIGMEDAAKKIAKLGMAAEAKMIEVPK